jgi:hypothetical protein
MNHRGESKGENKEEGKGEKKRPNNRPDATSPSKIPVEYAYRRCRLLRLKGRVLRLAILLVGLILMCVLLSDVLGSRAGSGQWTAVTLRQTIDLKIEEPWDQSKGDGELYFSSIRRRTSPDRISVSVLTSKKTFHRVQKHAAEWARAGVRLSVWVDELPAVVSPELKPFTYESTAKRQAWWKRTKQVSLSRHALCCYAWSVTSNILLSESKSVPL